MAKSIELPDLGSARDEAVDDPAVNFLDIPAFESAEIHRQEDELKNFTGTSLEAQRMELLKTKKVEEFLKAVAGRYGLLPDHASTTSLY